MIEATHECDLCGSETESKYVWTISITYGSAGGIYNRWVCIGCLEKKFDIPRERIRFFEALIEFRKLRKLSRYDCEGWQQHHIEQFTALLLHRKIPIRNYGIPLWEHNGNGVFLHDILETRDVHMPEEIVIDGHSYVRRR